MDWTGGYVTEAPYVIRFHRALNPRRIGLAVLANGFAAPNCNEPYTYMELGFGQGVSLVMLAAANPHAQFYGVDFLPEHVAHAQQLADAAGLDNLHLAQLSFADLHTRDWPAFDFIVMHGVWTWVAENFRAALLQFVDARLKDGGVAYVSYNALPGWATMVPVRELMKMEFDRTPGTLDQRIKAALRKVRALEKAQPLFFKENPTIEIRLGRMESEPAEYLAHEYFNAAWTPFYFEDVAADFGKIGLTFVASANLQDNVVDFTVRPEAKALYAEMKTTLQRETLKDVLANKQFRRDVYVRAPRVLNDAELTAAQAATRFAALMTVPELAEAKLTTEAATLKLNAPIHQELVAVLGQGPRTVAEVHADQSVSSLTTNAAYGTLFILAALNAVEAAAPEEVAASAATRTARLNAAITSRAAQATSIPALVSPVIGAGVDASSHEQLYMQAHHTGAPHAGEMKKGRLGLFEKLGLLRG